MTKTSKHLNREAFIVGFFLLFRYAIFCKYDTTILNNFWRAEPVVFVLMTLVFVTLYACVLRRLRTGTESNVLLCIFLIADPLLLPIASKNMNAIPLVLLMLLFFALHKGRFSLSVLAFFVACAYVLLVRDSTSFLSICIFSIYLCYNQKQRFSERQFQDLVTIASISGILLGMLCFKTELIESFWGTVIDEPWQSTFLYVPAPMEYSIPLLVLAVLLAALVWFAAVTEHKTQTNGQKSQAIYAHAVFATVQLLWLGLQKSELSYTLAIVTVSMALFRMGALEKWFLKKDKSSLSAPRILLLILLFGAVANYIFPHSPLKNILSSFAPF